MALNFSKIEPVQFGDLKVDPEVNPEKRLRLQSLKITEDNLDEARELLSSCFGKHADTVSTFMKDNLFLRDYLELQVYLTQGASGLDSFRSRIEKALDDKMSEAMKDA